MHGVVVFALTVFLLLPPAQPTVLEGTYRDTEGSTSLVQYLAKFGVKEGATARLSVTISESSGTAIFAFVPQSLWEPIFQNHTSCDNMASLLSYYAQVCACGKTKSSSCSCFLKATDTGNTTFPLQQIVANSTVYFHLFFIACYPNGTASNGTEFTYNIRVTNLLASESFYNTEFSYELIGVVLITMCSTATACILSVFHAVVHLPVFKCWKPPATRMHLLVKFYTPSPFLLTVGQGFQFVHWMVFANDGVGFPFLDHLGFALGGLSTWILVLVFILVSKGWQMTTRVIRRAVLTLLLWGLYIAVSIVLFVWTVVSELVFPYEASPKHPYDSWEGWLYQSYHVLLLFYLLYELWHSYMQENNPLVMNVYKLLAGGFVVWFGYLPLTVAVLYAVNTLEWTRVIRSTSLFFDLAANFVLIILFCPFWSDYFFQFNSHLNKIGHTRYSILSLSEKSVAL